MSATEEFSGFEVIRAAMEVEKKGKVFYSTMAEKAKTPLVKEIFSWLAQDEVQHLKTLEGLIPRLETGFLWEEEELFVPYLKRFSESEIFPSEARLQRILEGDSPDIGTLDLAIEAEERFAEYFQRAARHSLNPDGKAAFLWLAEEETRHAKILRERKALLGQKA